jgi:hypothetical protein
MRTFGDSTKTPGQFVTDRGYILAQFLENSNLDWARDLRAALGGDELKYQKYLTLRHRIQANKVLWKRVQDGTAEATVVVIENSYYIDAIAYRLKSQGAEIGHDVTFDDLLREAALCMIHHAPIMRFSELPPNSVAGRPKTEGRYTAASVYKRIGHKFNDAAIFAARAHAAFDVDDLDGAATTNDLFFGPRKMGFLEQVNKTHRVFDVEHPKSAEILNEMLSSRDNYDERSANFSVTRISESASETNDALQAADFCAGYASELMMNETQDRERALRRHFRRVIFNGAAR